MPPGNNLHRVVVYRDGGDKAVRTEPFTMFRPAGSTNPEDLWTVLQAYEDKTGGRLLAIPHNGNLSNGMMFPLVNPVTNRQLTREYAETRIRWEPLYEATQIKGDGEAHPYLSPTDEFADYETWDKGNLNLSELKTREMLQYEYARTALQLGLQVEQQVGVNPYKFGMIGSTDSHTSLATAEEENFFGKHSGTEPDAMRWEHPVLALGDVTILGWEQVSSGYAAVWATENTREAIFDAMMRRETYATTGPRMLVRFFGGWEFTADDAELRMPGGVGYSKGVPMGGDLPVRSGNGAPTFLVGALKDPFSGNLDRIQIVKGWLDGRGQRHEKVYDVAWSDAGRRQPGPDGTLPPVGNTVDVANATWTNTIGAPELLTVWTDPDFDASQPAVYYARVIEIPTPRWTAYDALRFGITMDPETSFGATRADPGTLKAPGSARSFGERETIDHTMNEKLTRWLREPLFHFLAIGVALFGLNLLLTRGDSAAEADRRVAVTETEIRWLRDTWQSRWQRPPTERELRGLVDDYVRQEVLYREALTMGLDRDDEVIRRRMVQKIEFLTSDLASQVQPTETQLQAYFQENLDRYLIPERRSFAHIYFNLDRRGEAAVADAERLLARLRDAPPGSIQPAELGDRFMLQHEYPLQREQDVARTFGQRFAAALFELEPGQWQGPIASGYGLHLAYVVAAEERQVPDLDLVRPRVLLDYGTWLREQANDAMLASVRSRYTVEIDEAAIRALALGGDSAAGDR